MEVEVPARVGSVQQADSHDGLQPSLDEDDMDVGEVSEAARPPVPRARRRADYCCGSQD